MALRAPVAADRDTPAGAKATAVFVLPFKIQRKRLEDIQQSMLRKGIPLAPRLDHTVTHVVTEFESLEQVEAQAVRSGVQLPEEAYIVSMKWLVESLKTSSLVPVLDRHVLRALQVATCEDNKNVTCQETADWACQRATKLEHVNKRLTCTGVPTPLQHLPVVLPVSMLWQLPVELSISVNYRTDMIPLKTATAGGFIQDALEILQLHAELRDGSQDYPRALAFRRASCVLKSLPFELKDPAQLSGFKDIGDHVRRVVMDILETGSSSEVQDIVCSQLFQQMKMFTAIFGVGPATAKNWIARGWTSIEDVRQAGCPKSDWRMNWGLAFYEDLIQPVSRQEADIFASLVQSEAENILPGTTVTLTGGFRRGKQVGHDVDLLITHPREGAEIGLLSKLLSVLASRDLVLIGHREKSSYRPDILYQDSKASMKGQLDHFEKWIGICKFPNSFQKPCPTRSSDHDRAQQQRQQHSPFNADVTMDNKSQISEYTTNSQVICTDVCEPCKPSQDVGVKGAPWEAKCPPLVDVDDSFDEMFEPRLKKSRVVGGREDRLPAMLAGAPRQWLARRVDLIVSPHSQFHFALFGWTGSKHFNRDARLYAQKVLGFKLTSHGLYDLRQKRALEAASEEDIFRHLNIPYRQPMERNC